uniref:FAD-binding PCMH-type domain-containing protein n=1 Tax=Bionectria ochroleuca TaxID=29856 RepID=A0A0B7KBA9_BIOOC
MWSKSLAFLVASVLASGLVQPANAGSNTGCRCVPGDKCWPSTVGWKAINLLLGNTLIKTEPIAQSCYDGPAKDLDHCSYVTDMWTDQDFQGSDPIGRAYPYNITCPTVDYDAGEVPEKQCILGQLPTRSSSLPVAAQSLAGQAAPAIHIDGAYQWRDVYKVAQDNNVIVVGGGSPTPGAIGGWPSGGGHGPATRNYGLGADQILELEVLLADGRIVTANHCQYTDLFRAIRGGGPGYGIVLSSTVKAYPNVDTVTAHHVTIVPKKHSHENKDLLDAVSTLMQLYPDLSDAGFAGYAFWFRNYPGNFIGDSPSGYQHGFWTIGKNQDAAEQGYAPVRKALEKYKDALIFNETWATYSDYWSFYKAESGLYDPVGQTSILTSRLIDRESVKDFEAVRGAVEVLGGGQEEIVSNVVLLVSGGKVFEDVKDTTSGLHPAWRRSSYAIITGSGVPKTASNELRKAQNDNITFIKGAATKKLAPNTGGYMNEGDRNDPDYINTFYGPNYESHLAAKKKYDRDNIFYCASCVGAEQMVDRVDGPLCYA